MSAGRSARSRTHPATPVNPLAHAGPSCLNCARLEGENRALRVTLDTLIARAMPNPAAGNYSPPPDPVVSHAGPAPEEQKPLPGPVRLAIVRQFPLRTTERAAHETMARDLLAAGENEGTVADMIANGRPIDL